MPIQTFVDTDLQGHAWPPDTAHEMSACLDIIERLWPAFHSQDAVYAIILNLHEPSADMVILGERGLGILELKHYYGSIRQDSQGVWYAGPKRIKASSFVNPHHQVQSYATTIRQRLCHPPDQGVWIHGTARQWNQLKIQTAVCFTHPNAHVNALKRTIHHQYTRMTRPWESFSILTPADVPQWVDALRFEINMGPAFGYEAYCLLPEEIEELVTHFFECIEWPDVSKVIQTGQAYALLRLTEGEKPLHTYGLKRDEALIGRDPTRCTVTIPGRFLRVSRVHARIIRSSHGLFIEDKSTNGTYIDGQELKGLKQLHYGQQITLGGPEANERVCMLRLTKLQNEGITDTEQMTRTMYDHE